MHFRFLPALAILLAALGGCARSTSEPQAGATPSTEPRLTASHLHHVTYRPWPRQVRVQGTLIGDLESVVGAEVAGVVREVKVDIGQEVNATAELVSLDPEPFELRVQQAKAELDQVRSKLGLKPDQPDSSLDPKKAPVVLQEQAIADRARFYLEQAQTLAKTTTGAIPAAELSKLEVDLRVAEARLTSAHNTVNENLALLQVRKVELAQAEKDLRHATIVAPFKGKIVARHRLPGTYVKVGDPVITLIRTDILRFEAGVPEQVGRRIQVNTRLNILIQDHEKPIPAKVSRLSPAIDPSNLTRTIQADISNTILQLPAGTFAEADIVLDDKEEVVAVPVAAVTEFAGEERVWAVRNQKLESIRVQTGRRDGDWIEIVKGLSAGDVVLRDAFHGKSGVRVQP
jgi:RND family efflux transporter MFP subunit